MYAQKVIWQAGATTEAMCVCVPGHYGPGCARCVEGQYCESGNASVCPSNSHSSSGAASVYDCACNAGFYGVGGQCRLCLQDAYCLGGAHIANCTGNAVTAGRGTIGPGFCSSI